jgi:hypothetical protein
LEERNGKKQENEVSRMNFLTKIKNWLEKEINTDWRIVALDLNRALIDLQEKYQQANQRIADLEGIVAIYKEKENAK